MTSAKPTVWFVDDLQSNLDAFSAAHSDAFNVVTFLHTSDVQERLKHETPDALLCDIFFYDTPEGAEAIESQIQGESQKLRQTALDIGAYQERYLAGISLMETVNEQFNGQFPVYAYTSKGPYLLETGGLDRIENSNGKLLLKGRLSRDVERMRISNDIEEFHRKNSLSAKLSRYLPIVLSATGVIGFFVGKLLEYLLGL